MFRTFLICAVLVGVAQVSQAGLSQDIRKLSKLVDVGTNGGDVAIIKYDISKFSYPAVIKNMLRRLDDNKSCKYTMNVGTTKAFSGDLLLTPEALTLLKKLKADGSLKAAVGYSWDGEVGDSEYCSTEALELYFINGEALIMSHDSTT